MAGKQHVLVCSEIARLRPALGMIGHVFQENVRVVALEGRQDFRTLGGHHSKHLGTGWSFRPGLLQEMRE